METKDDSRERLAKPPCVLISRGIWRTVQTLKKREDRGKLLAAICAWHFDGVEPEFNATEVAAGLEFAFNLSREEILTQREHYAATVEKSRAGGRAGRGVSRNAGNRNAARRFDPRTFKTAGKYSEEEEDATRQLFAELEPIFASVNREGTGSRRAFEFVLRKRLFERRGEIVENARAWANSAGWKRGFAKGVSSFFETGLFSTKPPQDGGNLAGTVERREAAILEEERKGVERGRAVLRVYYKEAREAFPLLTNKQLQKRIQEQREREGADRETAKLFAEEVLKEADRTGREERQAAKEKREREERWEAAILEEERGGVERGRAVLRVYYKEARGAVEEAAGKDGLRKFIEEQREREGADRETAKLFAEEVLKEGEEMKREAAAAWEEWERERKEREQEREREERERVEAVNAAAAKLEEVENLNAAGEELKKEICKILNAPRAFVYFNANLFPFTFAEIKQNRGEFLERVRAFASSREGEERRRTLSVLEPLEVGAFLKDLASREPRLNLQKTVEAVEGAAEAVEPSNAEETAGAVEPANVPAEEKTVEAVEGATEAVEPSNAEETAGAAANEEERRAKILIAEICVKFQQKGVPVFCNKSSKQFFKKNKLTERREEILQAVPVFPAERGGKRFDVGEFFKWFCKGGAASVLQIKSNLPAVEISANGVGVETGTAFLLNR